MFRDFISDERRNFKFQMGKMVASSLSGFLAGMLGGAIAVWVLVELGKGFGGL